jgi:hypothetical protein
MIGYACSHKAQTVLRSVPKTVRHQHGHHGHGAHHDASSIIMATIAHITAHLIFGIVQYRHCRQQECSKYSLLHKSVLNLLYYYPFDTYYIYLFILGENNMKLYVVNTRCLHIVAIFVNHIVFVCRLRAPLTFQVASRIAS